MPKTLKDHVLAAREEYDEALTNLLVKMCNEQDYTYLEGTCGQLIEMIIDCARDLSEAEDKDAFDDEHATVDFCRG